MNRISFVSEKFFVRPNHRQYLKTLRIGKFGVFFYIFSLCMQKMLNTL